MVHSPQARCEDVVNEEDEDCVSPPPSYTATPSPYMRPQKDTRLYHQQQQQAPLEHRNRQDRPSTTVLNLISAAAAYKSIITSLDATGTGPDPNRPPSEISTPTPPVQPAAATTTAMIPAATLHTQAPIPNSIYYAETHHPYPQTTTSSPSPPPINHQLHAPQPLRPLRSVRQLEPPPPQPQPQPQPLHPLTHPTTAPYAHAQLTSTRLAARTTASYPTILTPHPFIRALAARLVSPELISLYFADFHYCWPMLHRGRFLERLEEQPVELVWSVGLIGSLFLDQQSGGGAGGAASSSRTTSSGGSSPWGASGSPGSVRGSAMTRRDEEERGRSRQQQQRWGERSGGVPGRGAGAEERDTFRNAAREVHEWLLTNLSAHLNQVLSTFSSLSVSLLGDFLLRSTLLSDKRWNQGIHGWNRESR